MVISVQNESRTNTQQKQTPLEFSNNKQHLLFLQILCTQTKVFVARMEVAEAMVQSNGGTVVRRAEVTLRLKSATLMIVIVAPKLANISHGKRGISAHTFPNTEN